MKMKISRILQWDMTGIQQQFKKSGAAENIFFSTEGDGGIYTTTAVCYQQ
jgi:hypothetical protein